MVARREQVTASANSSSISVLCFRGVIEPPPPWQEERVMTRAENREHRA
jgi:hypothetical protein